MALDMVKLRNKLNATNETKKTFNDGSSYLFWNMKANESCTARFLEDGNQANNSSFWTEKQMINLEFPYILGASEKKSFTIQVPCIEMWNPDANSFTGEANIKCPVMEELRKWYKTVKAENDQNLEKLANKYWKKRTYIFQGFIRVNPIKEDVTPENPIRRLILRPQLFKILKSSLLSEPELDPTSAINGSDFNIRKIEQGGEANYTTSGWARKNSPLNDFENAAIEKYGLGDLSKFLPKRPDDKTLEVIYEMFEASVEGNPYDAAKWSSYFKPYGIDEKSTTNIPLKESVNINDSENQPWENIQPQFEPNFETKTYEIKSEIPNEIKSEIKGKPSTKQILDQLRSQKKTD